LLGLIPTDSPHPVASSRDFVYSWRVGRTLEAIHHAAGRSGARETENTRGMRSLVSSDPLDAHSQVDRLAGGGEARVLCKGAKELPEIHYPAFDPTPAIEAVREARRSIRPTGTIDAWMERQAGTLERSARMLAAVGTPAFFEYGRQIYGEPTEPLRVYPVTTIELAQSICNVIEQLARVEIDIAPPSYHDAEEVAKDIERAVQKHFGADAPPMELVDRLSAKAIASAKSIRIRRDARFTDRDALQLLHHEAYIHYATSFSGRAQIDLPILAASHPGTTRT
jgi:hypothetical protein